MSLSIINNVPVHIAIFPPFKEIYSKLCAVHCALPVTITSSWGPWHLPYIKISFNQHSSLIMILLICSFAEQKEAQAADRRDWFAVGGVGRVRKVLELGHECITKLKSCLQGNILCQVWKRLCVFFFFSEATCVNKKNGLISPLVFLKHGH